MKKNYIQPKITRVKLDHSQAILQACQVGGIYIGYTTLCGGSVGSGTWNCNASVRGAGGGGTAMRGVAGLDNIAAPS